MSFLSALVGLSMSEIQSAYPTSGGVCVVGSMEHQKTSDTLKCILSTLALVILLVRTACRRELGSISQLLCKFDGLRI